MTLTYAGAPHWSHRSLALSGFVGAIAPVMSASLARLPPTGLPAVSTTCDLYRITTPSPSRVIPYSGRVRRGRTHDVELERSLYMNRPWGKLTQVADYVRYAQAAWLTKHVGPSL